MDITPEVIEALRTLRKIAWGGDVEDAINILDNAGVFAAIDAATGYDVKASPEANVQVTGTIQCSHCLGDYKPKRDGTLRKHACWSYDQELKTVVYGPLDIHGRANRQENTRKLIQSAVNLKF